ncbi:hypothetical protein [Streptomyces violaceorubidus]|uniref:hypothetical protein n=1 Tax=Streptomyces violaceorubidus TaxID=284042 RepID=UPI0004C1BA83|nr:hypothetical protein [Streptomyces violaceorubidus]
MATTDQLIDQALNALNPKTGFHEPNPQQAHEATARANIAIASALTRIASALEQIAHNHNADNTVQPAIHHTA